MLTLSPAPPMYHHACLNAVDWTKQGLNLQYPNPPSVQSQTSSLEQIHFAAPLKHQASDENAAVADAMGESRGDDDGDAVGPAKPTGAGCWARQCWYPLAVAQEAATTVPLASMSIKAYSRTMVARWSLLLIIRPSATTQPPVSPSPKKTRCVIVIHII